jgi:hypothetical protein
MVGEPITGRAGTLVTGEAGDPLGSTTAANSWPAIIGGAYVAASSSLILLKRSVQVSASHSVVSPVQYRRFGNNLHNDRDMAHHHSMGAL